MKNTFVKQTIEESVRSVLTDSKALLQFALTSVIDAIRRIPYGYNNLLVSNTSILSTSIPAQDLLLPHIEDYNDMILDESKSFSRHY